MSVCNYSHLSNNEVCHKFSLFLTGEKKKKQLTNCVTLHFTHYYLDWLSIHALSNHLYLLLCESFAHLSDIYNEFNGQLLGQSLCSAKAFQTVEEPEDINWKISCILPQNIT